MAVVKTILTVVFIIISVALTVIILMQESKSAGLGAIAGAADTYWGKNKGRSMEGMLVKLTRIFVILFIVIAAMIAASKVVYARSTFPANSAEQDALESSKSTMEKSSPQSLKNPLSIAT